MKKHTFFNTTNNTGIIRTKIICKKIIYIVSTLFFSVSLQCTESSEIEISLDQKNKQTEQINQNTPHAFDLNLMRKQKQNTSHHSSETKQNGDGFFDPSFGSGQGYVIGEMGFNSAPRAVAIQPDNKVVVVGIRDKFALLTRYNENGSLDASFATAPYGPGVIIQKIGGDCWFNAVTIQKDKKIVVAGNADANSNSPGKCILARYRQNTPSNTNFILDTGFGLNGIVRTNIEGELNALAVQDGKIVVAGYNRDYASDTPIMVIRYNENGSLDTTFGIPFSVIPFGLGIATTYVGRFVRATGITIQEDNKIIVVGSMDTGLQHNIVIVRYTKDGVLDRDFGPDKNGVITLKIGKNTSFAYDVVVQKDGKIIVVGSSISEFNRNIFTIIRLKKDGSPDTDFGHDGIVTITPTDFINDNAYARSVVLDENEKIIVIGYTIAPTDNHYFSIVRYNTDGTLDGDFSDQGVQFNSLVYGNPLLPNKITIPTIGAIQNDNKKLVLAGMYSNKTSPTGSLMALARYNN